MPNKISTFLAKIFDNVYKHHAVICISILILRISLRLVDLNIYFYDVFFIRKKNSKKGYIEIAVNFTSFCISVLRIRLLRLNNYFYGAFFKYFFV